MENLIRDRANVSMLDHMFTRKSVGIAGPSSKIVLTIAYVH